MPEPTIARTEALIRRARRRAIVRELVARAGRGALAGAVLGGVLVGSDRLLGWGGESARWWLVGVPIALGLLWAGVSAWRARPGSISAAVAIDAALGFRDRLSSAIGLSREGGVFSAWAAGEAERVAGEADLRRVYPVRAGASWVWTPIVLGLVCAGAVWLPYARWTEPASARQAALREASEAGERQDAAAAVREAIEGAEALAREHRTPQASQDELQRLRELEEELAGGRSTRPAREVREEAAARLESIAEQLEREAQRSAEEQRALRDRFESIEPEVLERARELGERLRRGDLEGAEEEAERLAEASERMPAEERRQLAEELERLAEMLGEPSAGDDADTPDALDDAARALEQGRDAARDLARSREELRDALRERGMDEAEADRLAERAQEAMEREQASESSEQTREDMERALREESERLRRDPPSEPPGEPPGELGEDGAGEDPSEPGSAGDEPRPSPGEGDGARRESPSPDPTSPDPNGEPRPRPEPDPEGQPQTQPQPGQEPEPSGRDAPEPTPSPGGAEGPRPREPGAGEEPPTREQGEDGPRQEPGPEGDGSPAAQPGESDGDQSVGDGDPTGAGEAGEPGEPGAVEQPGQESGQETGDQPGAGEDASGEGDGRSLGERLREMRERMGDDAGARDAAQRLRERADRLRGEGDERDGAGEGPAPGTRPADRGPLTPEPRPRGEDDLRRVTETVDARPPEPVRPEDERVIAEWLGEGRRGEGGARDEVGERLREAVDAAERALEQQAVPTRRRELIRRVFDRVEQRAESREPVPAGDAERARDAERPPAGGG